LRPRKRGSPIGFWGGPPRKTLGPPPPKQTPTRNQRGQKNRKHQKRTWRGAKKITRIFGGGPPGPGLDMLLWARREIRPGVPPPPPQGGGGPGGWFAGDRLFFSGGPPRRPPESHGRPEKCRRGAFCRGKGGEETIKQKKPRGGKSPAGWGPNCAGAPPRGGPIFAPAGFGDDSGGRAFLFFASPGGGGGPGSKFPGSCIFPAQGLWCFLGGDGGAKGAVRGMVAWKKKKGRVPPHFPPPRRPVSPAPHRGAAPEGCSFWPGGETTKGFVGEDGRLTFGRGGGGTSGGGGPIPVFSSSGKGRASATKLGAGKGGGWGKNPGTIKKGGPTTFATATRGGARDFSPPRIPTQQ